MQIIEELLTCAYFESLGFHTRFVAPPGRESSGPDLRFLKIYNSENTVDPACSPGFQLFSADLQRLKEAVIVIQHWPNNTWEATALKNSKRLTAVLKKSLKPLKAEAIEPLCEAFSILTIPAWPSAEGDRQQTHELIGGLGIKGVITYRSMLAKLAAHPEWPVSGQNPVPGILRILKAFNLLSDPQREFFS